MVHAQDRDASSASSIDEYALGDLHPLPAAPSTSHHQHGIAGLPPPPPRAALSLSLGSATSSSRSSAPELYALQRHGHFGRLPASPLDAGARPASAMSSQTGSGSHSSVFFQGGAYANSYHHHGQHQAAHQAAPPAQGHWHAPVEGDALPAHSEWSPTWYSGGLTLSSAEHSLESRGAGGGGGGHAGVGAGYAYTSHAPRPSRLAYDWAPEVQGEYNSHLASEDVDEWTGPGLKRWRHTMGGEYHLGVGFADQAGRASTLPDHTRSSRGQRTFTERERRLQAQFGSPTGAHGGGESGEQGGKVFDRERIRQAKSKVRAQREEAARRSGVDRNGRLLVGGPRKRLAFRWFQGIGACAAGVCGIGTWAFVSPEGDPPPSSSLVLYVLYLFPFLSAILTAYLFVYRPYRIRQQEGRLNPRQQRSAPFTVPLLQGGPDLEDGVGCCCFGSRKPKGGLQSGMPGARRNRNAQPSPQVNLVLHPEMLKGLVNSQQPPNANYEQAQAETEEERRRRDRRQKRRRRRRRKQREREARADEKAGYTSADSYDSDGSSGSGSSSSSFSQLTRRRPDAAVPAISPFELEARWRLARARLRRVAIWDIAVATLWSAVALWAIAFNATCSPGSFQGWCDLYNWALALSVLLACSFACSFFLDIRDLRRTRHSPRLLHGGEVWD